ncbi:unnamed protein product [Ectocarpus sp. CCAP 1310/34]|nr:unnamed protein product [Ectocarpus sp. CCAP 1310/34]
MWTASSTLRKEKLVEGASLPLQSTNACFVAHEHFPLIRRLGVSGMGPCESCGRR